MRDKTDETKRYGRDETDIRIGDLLGRGLGAAGEDARVVIVGFPSDRGVEINGGRTGAKDGPAAIRRALYSLTPDPRVHERFASLLEMTADLGDLALTGNLEEDQALLGQALAPYLSNGAIPVILGGGHETSFGHFLGYVHAAIELEILNWDAHPDVRPLVDGQGHSGSPFRQIIKHPSGLCKSYSVAGLSPQAVAASHLRFLKENNCSAAFNDEISRNSIAEIYSALSRPTMVSFDIDAVDSAFAPGVSAVCVNGLSPELWFDAAYAAGRSPKVTSFDIVELNPKYDRENQTAKLAAVTVWHFLRGLVERAVV